MTILVVVTAAAAGWFAWTAGEYHLHRFAMHHLKGRGILSREHLIHHADPDRTDLALRIAAYVGIVLVGAAVAGVAAIWLPLSVTASFAAGWGVGYTFYEVFHWRAHFRPPSVSYELGLRRHHFHHHFGHPLENHGVTTTLWDRLYGTFARPERIRVPERWAMCWLIDEEGVVRPEFADDYEIVPAPMSGSDRLAALDEARAFANQAPLATASHEQVSTSLGPE